MHASWRVSASSGIDYYDDEEVIMVYVMSTAKASDTASPLTPTVTGDGVAESAVINRSSKQINAVDRVSSGYTADDLARAAMADAGITVNGVTAGADGEYTYDVTLANGATETLTTVTEKLYKVTVEFAACGWTSYLSSYNKTLWTDSLVPSIPLRRLRRTLHLATSPSPTLPEPKLLRRLRLPLASPLVRVIMYPKSLQRTISMIRDFARRKLSCSARSGFLAFPGGATLSVGIGYLFLQLENTGMHLRPS